MKESKFWVWFIPLFLTACIGIYFMINKTINRNEVKTNTDAIKIKEEYLADNNNYFTVNLSDNNVYKYINKKDLMETLEKKDGLIFIGNPKNNITRKNIVVLNDVVSSTSVPEIYYIDIKDIDDDLNDYLSDEKDINTIKSGTLISVEDGEILKVYYPTFVIDNKELTTNERDNLFNSYKEIVNKFIEECDENC